MFYVEEWNQSCDTILILQEYKIIYIYIYIYIQWRSQEFSMGGGL
jgi:hypothetical protein